jgi:hypothetical protein
LILDKYRVTLKTYQYPVVRLIRERLVPLISKTDAREDARRRDVSSAVNAVKG